jgi:predicted dehydrogenase
MVAPNKVAFIGLGRISDAHLDGLRRYNEAYSDKALRLAAVIDRFPGRAVEWCDRHFAKSASESRPHILEDYAALLEPSNRPDAVSILLPHHLHLEVGRPFLEAGIAVQMQKPLGLAMRDGR